MQAEEGGFGTTECCTVLDRGPYGSTNRRTCAAADAARTSLLNSGYVLLLPPDTDADVDADAVWLSLCVSALLLMSVSIEQLLLRVLLRVPFRSLPELSVVGFSMTSSTSFEMVSFNFAG